MRATVGCRRFLRATRHEDFLKLGRALLLVRGLGGASRDRTGDLYNAIVALSQLSYGPTRASEMLRARTSLDQASSMCISA